MLVGSQLPNADATESNQHVGQGTHGSCAYQRRLRHQICGLCSARSRRWRRFCVERHLGNGDGCAGHVWREQGDGNTQRVPQNWVSRGQLHDSRHYPGWGRGTPFLPFFLPCPFTSSSFVLFLLSPFPFLVALPIFLSIPPFYQNSHQSVSRPEVLEAIEAGFSLFRSFYVICIA